MTNRTDRQKGLRAIPHSIWALGLVSLFMDASSEMIHSLLPVFLTVGLGASALSVGIIEGVAEATAAITKVFSGAISDYLGRRKLLAVIGYGLAAITKPLFPLAGSVAVIFTARFIDRIGKGIRGAPRDALIGDIAPAHLRGACYGLRQTLDTVGAFIGPLLAILLMSLFAGDMRMVFWVAVIPAALAVAFLIFGVHEPETVKPRKPAKETRSSIDWTAIRKIGAPYWGLVGLTFMLMMSRMSEAFLILKAQQTGLALALIPMVLVVLNIAYALTAYPAGALSDRMKRTHVLAVGIVIFIIADIVLAFAASLWMVALGIILWGVHMGFTHGLLSAMVADAAPRELRGTAFGIFNLVMGLGLLAASAITGILWDIAGPEIAYLASAGFAIMALAGLIIMANRRTSQV